ncbi:hypothetical protein J2X06_002218 [Lysobacter niastensis]|uniref:Uncharacterized protein n=1 Tax=Lysobacter niastensis TaxID=380629 RepID=A0ABU1WC10_9GAMM|nr:hypothetical protein [Lysobacter niastensis]MDR7135009.1 hypothetical protein [Lysobacter niastensis]
MLNVSAFPLFFTVLVLLAVIALRWQRARFTSHAVGYRWTISALAASLCPTLVLTVHGGLPVPTVTGVIIALTQLESLIDLRLTVLGFGSKDAGVLVLPFVVCLPLILANPLSEPVSRPERRD